MAIVFPTVDIAADAIVIYCSVSFQIDEVRPGQSDQGVTVTIYGEKNANAAAPSTTNGDLSARTPTAASVMWQPEASAAVGDELESPDISSIVREIIALPDWAAGNPMAILFRHTAGSEVRWVEAASMMNDQQTPYLFTAYAVPGGGGGAPSETATFSINNILDDAEEDVSNGAMYMDSSDLEIMSDSGEQVVIVVRIIC